MKAEFPVYDLLFGEDPSALVPHPGAQREAPALTRPDAVRAGWQGGRSAAIGGASWPRSPVTGFPMIHLLTLELPEPYRRNGPELVGIALFQADDHVATATPGAREALQDGIGDRSVAFIADLLQSRERRHANQADLVDIIGGNFALFRLTAAELAGPRTEPPADRRDTMELPETGQDLNAWDHGEPERGIWLAKRAFDPNAGEAPVDVFEEEEEEEVESVATEEWTSPDRYVDVVLSNAPRLKAFYSEVHGRSHLGGTCLPCQAVPDGLTPWYIEVDDGVGGANFGGGNMQLDLESGVFEWAC